MRFARCICLPSHMPRTVTLLQNLSRSITRATAACVLHTCSYSCRNTCCTRWTSAAPSAMLTRCNGGLPQHQRGTNTTAAGLSIPSWHALPPAPLRAAAARCCASKTARRREFLQHSTTLLLSGALAVSRLAVPPPAGAYLVQFPTPRLNNRYILIRAGQSYAEADGETGAQHAHELTWKSRQGNSQQAAHLTSVHGNCIALQSCCTVKARLMFIEICELVILAAACAHAVSIGSDLFVCTLLLERFPPAILSRSDESCMEDE